MAHGAERSAATGRRAAAAPPAHRAALVDTDDARSLADLRQALRLVISDRVPDADRAADLLLAASAIASNAFRHGSRPVPARVWADAGRPVVAISDRGRGFDLPFAGFHPAHGLDLARGGMGLWLARKLWDHVDVLPMTPGVTVRLSAPRA